MSLEKVTISKVFISDKNKEGTPFKDKNGKPFWKVGIKTNEYGEDWFSTLCFRQDDRAMNLREGDTVNVVIEENNGFKNFKLPTKTDILEGKIEELNRRVTALEQGNTTPDNYPQAEDEGISPDDIPW
jgi:hypothetical protein